MSFVSTPEERALKRHLRDITRAVLRHLAALDAEMKSENSSYRQHGERVAALANALEIANDNARFFGLKIDYRTDSVAKKLKEMQS